MQLTPEDFIPDNVACLLVVATTWGLETYTRVWWECYLVTILIALKHFKEVESMNCVMLLFWCWGFYLLCRQWLYTGQCPAVMDLCKTLPWSFRRFGENWVYPELPVKVNILLETWQKSLRRSQERSLDYKRRTQEGNSKDSSAKLNVSTWL